jgi:hypothetical protein
MRFLLVIIFIVSSFTAIYGQDSVDSTLKKMGVGIGISSLGRYTLVESQYPSVGGLGFELGVRVRYWRLGFTGNYGLTFMQKPAVVNLESNRMESWGCELELRLGINQQLIFMFGMHGHYYNYRNKVTEIAPGVLMESLNNEITQEARNFGIGYQFNRFFRGSLCYQWERVDEQYLERRPSCLYLFARLTFILDTNVKKPQDQ